MEALVDADRAELVGVADAGAALDAAAGHPHREAVGVVVAARALRVFRRRLAAELAAPDHERLVEQAAALEVLEQARDRLVGAARVELVVHLEVAVRVPRLVVVAAAGVDLHESHAALNQPPREQQLVAELAGAVLVAAVELLGLLRLVREVDGLGRGRLHAVRELVALDAALELAVARAQERVARVPHLQAVEHRALQRIGAALRVREIEDRRAFAAQHGALVDRGHVAARPVLGARDRAARAVEHHHESRQVLVDRAEAVVRPRSERRTAEQLARVHHQHRRAVDRAVGVHALDERHVVDALRRVREEIAHPRAALAVLAELPLRADHAALVLVAAAALGLDLDRLAVVLEEIGLVVVGIDVARTAVAEDEDHALRLAWQHRGLCRKRVRADGLDQRRRAVEGERLLVEESVLREHARERHRGERTACLPEELAARAAAERVHGSVKWVAHGRSCSLSRCTGTRSC